MDRRLHGHCLLLITLIAAAASVSACIPQETTLVPLTPTSQATRWITQGAQRASPSPPAETPILVPSPNQTTTLLQPLPPTPENTLEGATVQDGPFTFDLRLYRKPEFGRNPPAPWMYSDLVGIGSHMMWVYHGTGMQGPVKVYWGCLPNLTFLSAYPSLKDGDNSGRQGGILLPEQSQANDRVQLVLKLETPQGTYGGSISFTLQQGRDGFEPVKVTIAPLTSNPPPSAELASASKPHGHRLPGRE
jgi:hypothetical protein